MLHGVATQNMGLLTNHPTTVVSGLIWKGNDRYFVGLLFEVVVVL